MYCYRRHSSPQISQQLPRLRLLSAAHFPAQRHRAGIVIPGTIPGFTGIFPHFFKSHRVVIRHTIRSGAGCVAGVVIIGTFCCAYCYPQHSSEKSPLLRFPEVVIHRTIFAGRAAGRVVIHSIVLTVGIFSSGVVTHGTFRNFAPGVVISGTIRCFSSGVVIQHTIPQKLLCRAGCWNARHISKILFCGLLSAAQFDFPAKILPQNFCEKNIFLRCYTPHMVISGTALWLFPAQSGWNARHISVVIFDIAIHIF